MLQARFRFLWLLPVFFLGALAYWYAASPVGPGFYPARLGGARFVHEAKPTFRLPIIWVRPHPWASLPPALQFAALTGEGADGPALHGEWRPTITWDRPDRPAWLQSRVQHGFLDLDFPAEGMTITGVQWQVAGEPERRFTTGDVRLVWAPATERAPVTTSGWANQFGYPYTEPGKAWLTDELVGHYFMLRGHGQVLDILSSLPGADYPIDGLVYREGREEMGPHRLYYQDPAYQPLTFPLTVQGEVTVYIPLSPNAQERLHDTYFYLRPAIVVAMESGPRTVAASVASYGLKVNPGKWRHWVPYYIYNWE